jgi:molybdenum cofactor cytidylyltransferase
MDHPISAVLLAAGLSRRMGRPKQLLPLGDRPAIVRCLEHIRGAMIDDIVVVVGTDADDIVAAIDTFPVAIARNEDPGSDMSQSLRVGLAKVSPVTSGVFVCLADQPMVRSETLIRLCLCHLEKPGTIIIPVFHGEKGHPPLFPKEIIAEIDVVPTLRDLIERHSGKVYHLEMTDKGIVLDMDTWEDYQGMIERFSSAAATDN